MTEKSAAKKIVWIVILLIAVIGVGIAGFFLARQMVRDARLKDAEEHRFLSATLSAETFVTPLGTPVRLTASAEGGKGTQYFEFYYMDGDEKVVIRESAPENTTTFNAERYGYYTLCVRVSDDTPMTADISASCRYGAVHQGIDVSVYQGNVQWEKVAAAGYDFAMIRSGFGFAAGQADRNFAQNLTGAVSAGLKVGVYHFSHATTAEAAKKEAAFCLSIIEPYRDKIDYPVVFDIEGDTQQQLSDEDLIAVTEAFCSTVAAAGYTPAVYTFDGWLYHHPVWENLQQYPLWVANWTEDPQSPYAYALWQYSNTGEVDGITGAVDLNYAFYDYENGAVVH